jgi:hypothetical protein
MRVSLALCDGVRLLTKKKRKEKREKNHKRKIGMVKSRGFRLSARANACITCTCDGVGL